jgi:hypothetical protein
MRRFLQSLILFIGGALLLAVLSSLSPTEAIAQLRATLIRNVDEPARIPYEHAVTPARPLTNVYRADFPAVPAGRRLKLTRISGWIQFVDASNLGAFVSINNPGTGQPRVAFPLSSFIAAYFGRVYSFDIETDFIFEAGQSPRVEMGVSAFTGNLPSPSGDHQVIRAHGYLIDLSL